MVSEALPTERILVTVLLPCLNEEASVGLCVDEASTALAAAGIASEVLVVDNNSTDRSVEVALAHGARVISERRPGYGRALRTGIEAAAGSIIVMADADLTYDLSRISELVSPIVAGSADIVVGERLTEAQRATMSVLHRRVGTPVLTLLVKRATNGVTLSDSQSGYRAFRRDDVLRLGMTATGMEFASEMLIRATRAGLRVIETSTGYRERVGDSKLSTFSDGWRHLRQILLLAPHLMLVAPGFVLIVIGLGFQLLGLLVPSGLSVGSLRWQPSFISGIALVIGVQALVAGFVLSERQRVITGRPPPRAGRRPSLSSVCLVVGLIIGVAGVGIDLSLFFLWLNHVHSFTREIALEAMAQSAVIDGASLTGFGFVFPIVARNWWGDAGGSAGRAGDGTLTPSERNRQRIPGG